MRDVLIAVFAMTAVAAGGDSGGHGSGSGSASSQPHISHNEYTWEENYIACRNISKAAFAAQVGARDYTNNATFDKYVDYRCRSICPSFGHGDLKCSWETHHALEFEGWNTAMMWGICYLGFALVIGAFGAVCLKNYAPCVPYTVAILGVGIFLGGLSSTLEKAATCPTHALDPVYDWNHNGEITQEEFLYFKCDGCDLNSVCYSDSKRAYTGPDFNTLDQPIHWSAMDPAFALVGDNFDFLPDDVLEADELWRPGCNLLSSILALGSQIDPHLLLVIFLPPLLFESAYAMDNAIFDTQFYQICLLAIPGVVVSSLLNACVMWLLYPNWVTFTFGWLAGTILSATDPVAVVALLKEVGAAKTLGTIIEGESLLNDGSSVVLFTFIMSLVKAGTAVSSYDQAIPWTENAYLEFIRIMFQMLILGPIFGLAMGHVCCRSLRSVYNDMVVEVAIILSCTYLTFWISEVLMKSAAVLSVVAMGYVINNERLSISVEVHHFLHEFFEMVAWCLNTVIFLICGVKLGEVLAAMFSNAPYAGMDHDDILRAILVYLGCNVVRLMSITFFSPALARLGTGFDWRTLTVCVWGGLRGSVGLALALVVMHTRYQPFWGGNTTEPHSFEDYLQYRDDLPCRDVPTKILIATSSVILFTVVVNGSTMAYLIAYLGLDALSDDRKFMLDRAMKKLKSETAYIIGSIKYASTDENVDWSLVREKFTYHKAFDFHVDDEGTAAQMQALNMERMSYLEQHEKGEISDRAASFLNVYMLRLQARAEAKGATTSLEPKRGTLSPGPANAAEAMYNETVQQMESLFEVTPWKVRLRSFWLFRDWAERAVFDELSLAYEVGKAYIKASECVKKLYEMHRDHQHNHGEGGGHGGHGGKHPPPKFGHMASSGSSVGSERVGELERISTRGMSEKEKSDLERQEQQNFERMERMVGGGGGRGEGSPASASGLAGKFHAAAAASPSQTELRKMSLKNTSGGSSEGSESGGGLAAARGPKVAIVHDPMRMSRESSSPEEKMAARRLSGMPGKLKRQMTHLDWLNDLQRGREKHAAKMNDLIRQMQESYPDVSLAVETRYVATLVLRRQLRFVEHMRHDGEINEMDAATLTDDINKQRKTLFYARSHRLGNKGPKETLIEVPAFRFLSLAVRHESTIRTKDVRALQAREECKTLLERLVEKLTIKAYNSEDIVVGPSLIEARKPGEKESAAPVAVAPIKSFDKAGRPVPGHSERRRRRSVMDQIVAVAHNVGDAVHDVGEMVQHITRMGSREMAIAKAEASRVAERGGAAVAEVSKRAAQTVGGVVMPNTEAGSEREDTKLPPGVARSQRGGDRTNRRVSVKAEKAENKEAKRVAERSIELHELYDNLIVVKRGQLSYGSDAKIAAYGSQRTLALTGAAHRKLGPFSATGVACVLQQMNLDELDYLNKLPPPITCTRAAEVLVISGKSIREAIREGGSAGEALMRELWCMHAKEVASRFMRARPPYSGWPEAQLGEHLERGSLLEWEETDFEVNLRMVHMGMLISGECVFEHGSTTDSPIVGQRRVSLASQFMNTVNAAQDAEDSWVMSGGKSRRSGGSSDSMRASKEEGDEQEEDEEEVLDWRPAPVMLRPGDRVRIRQCDPLLARVPVEKPDNKFAVASGREDVSVADSTASSSSRSEGPVVAPGTPGKKLAGAPSGRPAGGLSGTEARMNGHMRIRVLALPSDTTPLLMEAPCVMPIAVDSSAPRYGRDLQPSESFARASDLKRMTQGASMVNMGKSRRSLIPSADESSAPGAAAVSNTAKNFLSVIKAATSMKNLGVANVVAAPTSSPVAAESSAGRPQKSRWLDLVAASATPASISQRPLTIEEQLNASAHRHHPEPEPQSRVSTVQEEAEEEEQEAPPTQAPTKIKASDIEVSLESGERSTDGIQPLVVR